MKYAYDAQYVPPAPVVEILLGAPEEPYSVGPLHTIVDTGADATLVPLGHIKSLGLPIDNRKYLCSQFGERILVDVYTVDIGLDGLRFPLIEVIADESGNEAILGRNIPNKLVVTLDGPRQVLELCI